MSTKSRKLRFFSLFWDYASALSLIALLVLLWHLGKGPVKVNFLRPYIIQALTNETSDYDLSVGSVNLELVHSVQPVKIIAKDVQFKDKEGEYLVEAPRLSLSFSARALLKGMLAPSSIAIERPRVRITASYGLKGGEDGADATGAGSANADTAGTDESGAAGGGKTVTDGTRSAGGKAAGRGEKTATRGEKTAGRGGKAGGRIRTAGTGNRCRPKRCRNGASGGGRRVPSKSWNSTLPSLKILWRGSILRSGCIWKVLSITSALPMRRWI